MPQPSISERVSAQRQSASIFLSKRVNLVVIVIMAVVLGRSMTRYRTEKRMLDELLQTFDLGQDNRLTTAEMTSLLEANGLRFSQEQVRVFFGREDDENDGYDSEELAVVLNIILAVPAVSDRIKATSHGSLDLCISMTVIALLSYLVIQNDTLNKKLAGSAFVNAVKCRQMKSRCGRLNDSLSQLTDESGRLEDEILKLEGSPSDENGSVETRTKELHKRLGKVGQKQQQIRTELEKEVGGLKGDVQRYTQEANLSSQKLLSMMSCIRGLDSFTGAGKGKFAGEGAQRGFCTVSEPQKNFSFNMESTVFGTIEDGQLLLYQTSRSRVLGTGADGAFRCTDLSTGRELALKMYGAKNPEKKGINSLCILPQSDPENPFSRKESLIRNDIYAHCSQVASHPRIVKYERIIEAEDTIFVLMELLDGKSLYDLIRERGLREAEARPLFRHLVEAVRHLHENQVIHCDIKPENAMVSGDTEAHTAELKLIDFGCSCFMNFSQDGQDPNVNIVWDRYMAPEHYDTKVKPTESTDMWRLGCSLFVMLLRRHCFEDPNREDHHCREQRRSAQIRKDEAYEALSQEAQDLLQKLIVDDPKRRLSAAGVLAHPWLCDPVASAS